MTTPIPEVSGYVLAGGRSSRMGTDKALLPLAGKPLVQHAVTKLRRVCEEVHILGSNPALAAYAPLVPDIHPWLRASLEAHGSRLHPHPLSPRDWSLFLAVDLPFLPSAFIFDWASQWLAPPDDGHRIRIFSDDGRPHPTFCLLHKDVLPFLSQAVSTHQLKLGCRSSERRGWEWPFRSADILRINRTF